jgi:hypothetical protein
LRACFFWSRYDCGFQCWSFPYLLVLLGWPKTHHCPVKSFGGFWVIHAREGPASVSGPCRHAAARTREGTASAIEISTHIQLDHPALVEPASGRQTVGVRHANQARYSSGDSMADPEVNHQTVWQAGVFSFHSYRDCTIIWSLVVLHRVTRRIIAGAIIPGQDFGNFPASRPVLRRRLTGVFFIPFPLASLKQRCSNQVALIRPLAFSNGFPVFASSCD